ncbi:alpha/beta fold hydrolase [Streptomyces sp. NPDC041068]|uniref:thioesterase II family protein n=1 Tax=Streptomyces sp. NPDC041068 TaxID=3155130 RepID=UPI003404E71C
MSAWTVRRHRRPDAAVSLFCFPHAGGSPGEYVRWADDLPDVQVWGVHLPGRTTRQDEPPFSHVGPLVDALVTAVPFDGDGPFVLFGHSLGALLAFETAQELRRRGRRGPDRLIVSSCPAPPLPVFGEPVHLLPDEALLSEIERRWGEPLDHLRAHPDLRADALNSFRTDFALLGSYLPTADAPLTCPVTAFAGTDEPGADTIGGWSRHTTGPTDIRLVPGGHFYFRDSRTEALSLVRETVLTRSGALLDETNGGTEWSE